MTIPLSFSSAGSALLFLLLAASFQPVQAQEFGRAGELETNSAYFFYGRPGEATIQVNVLGVRQSGL